MSIDMTAKFYRGCTDFTILMLDWNGNAVRIGPAASAVKEGAGGVVPVWYKGRDSLFEVDAATFLAWCERTDWAPGFFGELIAVLKLWPGEVEVIEFEVKA